MYECKHYFPSVGLFAALIALGIGIYLLSNVANPFAEHRVRLAVFSGIMVLGCAAAIFGFLEEYRDCYNEVFLKYHRDGEYETVTGEVTDFDAAAFLSGPGWDHFTVEGVKFDIGGTNPLGYQKNACYHGLINREGMQVEIRYITYKMEKYIMYIRILDESRK